VLLVAQEGDEENGGVSGFMQGCRKAPGGACGVAVMVEVEAVLREAGKVDEGEDGAGGQWDEAAALASAIGVSRQILGSE